MESWSVSPSRCGQWICCRIHSEFAAGYIVYPTISTKANFACTTENRWIWLEDHHPNCLVASKSCHLHRVGVRPTLLQLFFSNDFNHMFWRKECTLLLNEGIGNVASSMEYFSSWCHTLSCHFDSSSNMVHLTFTVTGYTVHPDDIFVIHFSDDLQMLKMESWLTLGGAIITTNDDIAALYIFLCKHFSNHNISENLALLPGIEYIYISVCVCVWCDRSFHPCTWQSWMNWHNFVTPTDWLWLFFHHTKQVFELHNNLLKMLQFITVVYNLWKSLIKSLDDKTEINICWYLFYML